MTLMIETRPLPLKINEQGVILVTGTRVPIDTIIRAYHQEDSAEDIVKSYDVLKLADVYFIIGYYLENQEEIDAYLQRREAEAEAIRREIETRFDQSNLWKRVRARRQRKHA